MATEDVTKVVSDPGLEGSDARLASERDSESLTSVGRGAPQAPLVSLARGSELGRYVILDPIASGGMGSVYVAYDPELDRKVAVKVLKKQQVAELGGEDALLREAQAMAKLSHPNVVNVFDTGLHDGAVFVAMEYVEGVTLRRWLQAKRRSWQEIVDTFVQAGQGLAAAHRSGIVHRDFKPANVMVDEEGRPRVLDFGLAFPVEQYQSGDVLQSDRRPPTSSSSSLPTPVEGSPCEPEDLLFGTPPYMSPEQWLGGYVDARSDQFSFCVALWDALYEHKPFSGEGLKGLREAILAGQVAEPRVSRGPLRLRRHLERGLRPASAERYPDMEALLVDLARDARFGTRRILYAAVALGGVGLVGVGYFGAAAAKDEPDVCTGGPSRMDGVWDADRREEVERAFEASGQPYARDSFRTVRGVLDRNAEKWVAMFTDACEATRVRGEHSERMLDRRMRCLELRRSELSSTVELLATGEPDVVEHAVETVESLTPISRCSVTGVSQDDVPPPAAEIAAEVARLEEAQARAGSLLPAAKIDEAEAIVEESLQRALELDYAPLLASLYLVQAELLAEQGDPAGLHEAALTGFGHAVAGKADHLAATLMTLRVRAAAMKADAEGGPELMSVAEAWMQRVPHDATLAYRMHSDAGLLLYAIGDYPASVERFERALKIVREELPDMRYRLAATLNNLGGLAGAQREYARSLEYMNEALAIDREVLGEDHPWTITILENVATSNHHLGNTDLARRQFEKIIDVRRKMLGDDDPTLARAYNNLASMLIDEQRSEEALPVARRALEIRTKILGSDHFSTALVRINVAQALSALERYEEARGELDEAVEDLEPESGPHPYLHVALVARARLYREQGRYAEALADLDHVARIQEQLRQGEILRGELDGERARVLAAQGKDVQVVRDLVARALARLDTPDARRELRDLNAWLDEYPQYRPTTP